MSFNEIKVHFSSLYAIADDIFQFPVKQEKHRANCEEVYNFQGKNSRTNEHRISIDK